MWLADTARLHMAIRSSKGSKSFFTGCLNTGTLQLHISCVKRRQGTSSTSSTGFVSRTVMASSTWRALGSV